MNVREEKFRSILEKHPDLCAGGFVGEDFRLKDGRDFSSERSSLEGSFRQFALCCEWLLDCTPLKHVSFVSPLSTDLLPHIEKALHTAVSNGALIAAVLHMKIPHRALPDSAAVRIGISLRSPTLQEMVLNQKPGSRSARR